MNHLLIKSMTDRLYSRLAGVAVLALLIGGAAQATPFTVDSPAGGTLPAGATPVGGVVLDLVGSNGARVVSQLAASSLFSGYCNTGTPAAFRGNPCTVGIQNGFDSSITGALGGGLSEAAVRFTLDDGDTAAGDFDENQNTLLLNGFNFGDWSDVQAQETDSTGTVAGSFSGGGFRDELLDTGFFFSDDAALLTDFFSSLLSSEQVSYQINDLNPNDNFFDFTQGVDGSLLDVGQGPVVTPPDPGTQVPEPSPLGLLALALLMLGIARGRRWQY